MKKGYAILNRDENGTLKGLCDVSTISMVFVEGAAYVWKTPPTHYFNPKRGDFLAKTDRVYGDVKFNGKRFKSRPRNYTFEQIIKHP